MEADTISVPKHASLFGGLIIMLKLTEEQKQAIGEKKRIAKLKIKIEELEEMLKAMVTLEKKDKAYYEKSIFWELIKWDVKK